MPWPFPDFIRPYMRMASYWLDLGWIGQQILDWARGSRHYYDLTSMEQAIPEAARANYFRNFILGHDPNTSFLRQWGWASRGAWYAGYGRAPTTAELAYAYQRPSDTIGLAFQVRGHTLHTRAERVFSVTVNAPWTSNLWDVSNFLRDQIAAGAGMIGDTDYDPLDPASVTIALVGGALVGRQEPTFTIP